ncbi:MAG: hypothetical protein Q9166_000979 [cf. Caloplaca sp. 2 TL-2023]
MRKKDFQSTPNKNSKMSLINGDVLPLPSPPKSLESVPELQTAWKNLVELADQVSKGPKQLEDNAGPIMLALKCLKTGEEKFRLAGDDHAMLGYTVLTAASWVSL